jgi:spore germination protein KC
MPKRRAAALIVIAATSCLLAGCWDRREINDVAFVLGTALDKVNDEYRATVQFPLPSNLGGAGSKGGGGGTGGTKAWYTDSVIGKSLSEIRFDQQRSISRFLFLGHRRIFLFGEELARSGIEYILDEVVRNPISRLDTYVLVTEGEAMNVLNAEVTVEKYPSEIIRELANTFMRHPSNFKYIIDTLNTEGMDLVLPYVREHRIQTGDIHQVRTAPKVESVAIFHRSKMIGVLSDEHSGILLWMMNEARRPIIVFPSPKGKGWISVQIQKASCNIRPVIRGRDISFRITLNGYGYVLENISNMEITDFGNLEKVEHALRTHLEEQAREALALLQRKWNSDPIGLGRILHQRVPGLWKEIKGEWRDIYREIDISVTARVHIENTGLLISPAGIDEREVIR